MSAISITSALIAFYAQVSTILTKLLLHYEPPYSCSCTCQANSDKNIATYCHAINIDWWWKKLKNQFLPLFNKQNAVNLAYHIYSHYNWANDKLKLP